MSLRLLSPLLVLALTALVACSDKDSSDDDDDGGGGGGWDLGLGDGGGGDGGGGGGDGGTGPDSGSTDEDGDGWSVEGGDCDDDDPDINPGADEIWYDGTDQDCDGADDYDQDGDGHALQESGGDDCDDTDGDRYPDAYDRPNDGIDQDCDDEDRSFDGLVLDPGDSTDVRFTVELPGSGAVDLGLIVDTTGSMSSTLASLDASVIAAGVSGSIDDLQIGLATYADYNYSGYGSGSDKPFVFRIGSTSDIDDVDSAIGSLYASGGSDGPESTMEALYQALTGAGYDQDCDSTYDSADDVLPFLSSSGDPFGGSSTDSYDATTAGIGTRGGLGFRSGALPVLVYITDNYLRDADNPTYGTPGGCPLDAGESDVVDAADDLGAWLVGIATNSTPVSQMTDLAEATGSLADTDGDGHADDPLVYSLSSTTTMNARIVDALEAIAATGAVTSTLDLVAAAAAVDSRGLVSGISPASYTAVDTSVTPTVDFTVTLTAPGSTAAMIQTTVVIEVEVDGSVAHTEEIAVELAPAG